MTSSSRQIGQTFSNLLEVFRATTARFPRGVAVKSCRYVWTWEELNARANLVAARLWEAGIDRQTPVALFFEPDAPLLAALLGVLQTGQFVVILDPTLPDERNRTIIEDSCARRVIAGAQHATRAARLNSEWDIIQIPELEGIALTRSVLARQDVHPAPRCTPDDLACLIYTSGSTGRPKGVMNTHRMLLSYGAAFRDPLQITEHDRLSWLHSPSVAGAWRQLVASLLSGATLYPLPLAKEGLHGLARLLERQKITVLHSIASVIRNLDEILPQHQRFPDVRAVVFGGERVWKRDVEAARRRSSSQASVLLGLGCSEAGSICNYLLRPHMNLTADIAPLGRPNRHQRIQLWDEKGQPVPAGEVGQIVVSSPSLSLGYWRQPELTNRVFRNDPDNPGSRCYCTGDLGRFTPDGLLWHAGRNDSQVKIRGFRIDLSEIETALAGHAGVRDALVQVFPDERGDNALAAYVLRRDDADLSVDHLRQQLQQRLPAHMIPTWFMLLSSWPLTPGGKIDRRALPGPGTISFENPVVSRSRSCPDEATATAISVVPTDEIEVKLLALWRAVLGRTTIGLDDNFFALGGHSLKAAQLFYRIQTEFGQALPLSILAEHPTVAQLARILRNGDGSQPAPFLVDLKPNGSKPPVFMVHGIGGEALAYRHLVPYFAEDWPLIGIQGCRFMRGKASVPRLEKLASLYLEAVRERQPHGPYHLVGYSAGGRIVFEMARQLRQAGESVPLLVIVDAVTDLKFSWQQTSVSRFVSNAYWLMRDDWAHAEFGQWLKRAALKTRGWTRSLVSRSNGSSDSAARLGHFFDTEGLPSDWMRFMQQLADACQKYRLRAYPGKVQLIRCRGRGLFADHRPDLGWREFALGGVDIHRIRGDHHTILREPHVQSLCAALNLLLSRLESRETAIHQATGGRRTGTAKVVRRGADAELGGRLAPVGAYSAAEPASALRRSTSTLFASTFAKLLSRR